MGDENLFPKSLTCFCMEMNVWDGLKIGSATLPGSVWMEADYETNRIAKEEIEELQTKLSRIEVEKLDKIIRILEGK